MVTRDDKITQSVQDYVRGVLFGKLGYPADKVEMLDAFPANRFTGKLDKNYVAAGFNFDDGGEAGEMGSDLTHRIYTVEFFVFGMTPVWGRNIGSALRTALEQDPTIPLKDIGESDDVIDSLTIPPRGLRARHLPIRDPRPWEENVWVVTVNLEDYYYAAVSSRG